MKTAKLGARKKRSSTAMERRKHNRWFRTVCTRNLLDVAIFVNCLAVFIGAQVGLQVNGLAAKYAGYFWEVAAAHKRLLLGFGL
jgi:hypothetical protein